MNLQIFMLSEKIRTQNSAYCIIAYDVLKQSKFFYLMETRMVVSGGDWGNKKHEHLDRNVDSSAICISQISTVHFRLFMHFTE